ncbi:adenylyltransferase/cytidyltransferase family protein [Pseudoalteromonas sp. NEC-BIFX-2020_002]|uniref:PfkB family carbohydrate kinase n=1 Tax=Pseudoalteromonas sp. NEC-BIFX-2020_002 TaxID=2732353 RepID=UPI0014773CEF|nr:adenylyltransferase/cytidyltransferase family protein [Pseudoalteromonas sp. NEC-BIFX-2020_002]
MKRKTVLVIGNFDILHPGHIRLLKFAKECGDYLIVAVNNDSNMLIKSRVSELHRLEMVQSLECVDEAFLTELCSNSLIANYQPYAVVKGKEFEEKENPEYKALKKYGGKLIFGSGEFESNSEQYITRTISHGHNFDYKKCQSYATRHQFDYQSINTVFSQFRENRVAVIGEIIVDEYIQGTAVGLSQEDPTIVMTPDRTDTFLGGAAITAGHIKGLGAKNVKLFSVLGKDDKADYVKNHINAYNIDTILFDDGSRPTPLKSRYRAGNKTLLRVNQVRQHKISKEIQTDLYMQLESSINNFDLLVFSDFNYGLLPQTLVDKVIALCKENDVHVVADSQTSSQVGDIARYKDMMLVTPTEKEVRVALNNIDDGLPVLAQKLCEKANPTYLVITLAGEGVFIHLPNQNGQWENDMLPAINSNAVDPAGAGDCFLAASSLALCSGATPWQAFYIASIAAACQVDTLGNQPLSFNTLQQRVLESFKL